MGKGNVRRVRAKGDRGEEGWEEERWSERDEWEGKRTMMGEVV